MAWRRGHGGAPLPHRRRRRDLRQRPRIVPRRSPVARELRSSGAGQGASLLAEQRHRLHGDAVLPGPHVEGRAPGDARAAGRSLAEGADRAGARRARATARARRLSSRRRARQHPRAARRPAGAARLRLRAPRRRRRLAVVHCPSQAAVRAAGAVRRRRQRRPGAVDRPVLARRDAAFRRHRPRADRLGGARRARHAASPFVVAAAGDFARPARHHRLDPRPRARRSAAGRRDGATSAPRRDRAATATAGADRGRRPGRGGGARCAGGRAAEGRSRAGRSCAARGGASWSRRALGCSAVDRVRRSGRAGRWAPIGAARGFAGGDPAVGRPSGHGAPGRPRAPDGRPARDRRRARGLRGASGRGRRARGGFSRIDIGARSGRGRRRASQGGALREGAPGQAAAADSRPRSARVPAAATVPAC